MEEGLETIIHVYVMHLNNVQFILEDNWFVINFNVLVN